MPSRREFLSAAAAAVGALSFPGVLAAQSSANSGSARNALAAVSPLTKLNNGVEMPVFGVGTYALPTFQAAEVIRFALNNGYRLIDTAANYGNEKEVGEGIASSGVPRSDVFVTTKLWLEHYGYDAAMRAFDESLRKLKLDYLDLYLLHWPQPVDFEKTIASYKALEKLYADKRIRAIGVSNFNADHLQLLRDRTEIVPAINQVELHPYLSQEAVVKANDRCGIKTECWSPIGGIFTNHPRDAANVVHLLEDPVVVKLGQKHRKTPAQIVLRWHNQHGWIVIPKSQHYERLLKNIDIFRFELSTEDIAAIDGLNRNLRGGPDPNAFDLAAFKAAAEKRRSALD